ncbi:hypothetical protein K438DRAFT_1770676 [Mycena galopus ATCC 62051]|nr:hypothetical protein K438DRAFT_1770676 [Mycena galopus ATCC 62051]
MEWGGSASVGGRLGGGLELGLALGLGLEPRLRPCLDRNARGGACRRRDLLRRRRRKTGGLARWRLARQGTFAARLGTGRRQGLGRHASHKEARLTVLRDAGALPLVVTQAVCESGHVPSRGEEPSANDEGHKFGGWQVNRRLRWDWRAWTDGGLGGWVVLEIPHVVDLLRNRVFYIHHRVLGEAELMQTPAEDAMQVDGTADTIVATLEEDEVLSGAHGENGALGNLDVPQEQRHSATAAGPKQVKQAAAKIKRTRESAVERRLNREVVEMALQPGGYERERHGATESDTVERTRSRTQCPETLGLSVVKQSDQGPKHTWIKCFPTLDPTAFVPFVQLH